MASSALALGNIWKSVAGTDAASIAARAQKRGALSAMQEESDKAKFTPSAETAAKPDSEGKALSETYKKLPSIPQGQRLADFMPQVESLAKTDLTTPAAAGTNPALGDTTASLYRDPEGNLLSQKGESQAAGGKTVGDYAQQYGGDVLSAAGGIADLFKTPQRNVQLPQPGATGAYTPTAGASLQRLMELAKMRRGY